MNCRPLLRHRRLCRGHYSWQNLQTESDRMKSPVLHSGRISKNPFSRLEQILGGQEPPFLVRFKHLLDFPAPGTLHALCEHCESFSLRCRWHAPRPTKIGGCS
ncbi:hypothetical protein BDV98DRAFT_578421, partial [Pterulicium gracile]